MNQEPEVAPNYEIGFWDQSNSPIVESFIEVKSRAFRELPGHSGGFLAKHLHNPFGPSIITYAALNGEVVAFRALMPAEFVRGVQTFRAYQACDTSVSPEHQRRGLFRILTERAVEGAITQGADFIFNFPNPMSLPQYLKMGWAFLADLELYLKPAPISLFPLNRFRRGECCGELPEFIPSVILDEYMMPNRTGPYVEWRKKINAKGSLCVFKTERVLVIYRLESRFGFRLARILDVVAEEYEGIPGAIGGLYERANVDFCLLHISSSHRFRPHFKKEGWRFIKAVPIVARFFSEDLHRKFNQRLQITGIDADFL